MQLTQPWFPLGQPNSIRPGYNHSTTSETTQSTEDLRSLWMATVRRSLRSLNDHLYDFNADVTVTSPLYVH